MAQLYSTGPVSIWVGANPGGTPVFLGHGRQAPIISHTELSRPVPTDLSAMMKHDRANGGEALTISVLLQRYNESVLRSLGDVAGARSPTPTPGTFFPGDLGSLSIEEGTAWPLWLIFPHAFKAAMNRPANGLMRAGYFIYAAVLDSDREEVGWGPYGHQLNVECLPVFDPTMDLPAGGGLVRGGFRLYRYLTREELSGFSGLN